MVEITVTLLSDTNENEYEDFISKNSGALFFHSIKYRKFLNKILENVEDLYLLAHANGELVGVLPAFLKSLPDGKSVINSLPFYGSHGGVLVAFNIENPDQVKKALIEELMTISEQKNVASLTIVDNPAAGQSELYKEYISAQASDERIGQITDISTLNGDVETELMDKFHSKTRNMVRKGMKSGFTVKVDESFEGIKILHDIHSQNMEAIGGTEKPLYVFEAIHEIFEGEKDYRIYFAEKNNEIAAGLLVFYYKDYCEYFTPVVKQEYRSEQPLSLLIFKAMQDASKRGMKYWNWGGTWLTQEGVYKFKTRWGSEDHPYYYFTKIYDQSLLDMSKEELLKNYPHFFVLPFTLLKS